VLWSGVRPSLASAVPSTALYFTCYDVLKRDAERLGAGGAAPALAGVAGRVLAVTAVSPLELIRTREMHARSHLPLLRALRREVAARGSVWALWRGFAATLWRDVPFSGIYWVGYERLKALVARELLGGGDRGGDRGDDRGGGRGGDRGAACRAPSLLDTFAIAFTAGVVSGSVAAVVTTPFDVVKTRRQVEGMAGAGAAAPAAGTLATLARIARHEGVAGLFAGGTARVAKVAPSCAIMIGTYEIVKRALGGSDGDGCVADTLNVSQQ